MAASPDLNGDGVFDLLIGAPEEGTVEGSGHVHVYSGASDDRLGMLQSAAPERYGAFGLALAAGVYVWRVQAGERVEAGPLTVL